MDHQNNVILDPLVYSELTIFIDYYVPSLKYRLIFLRVLKVSDDPSDELNT